MQPQLKKSMHCGKILIIKRIPSIYKRFNIQVNLDMTDSMGPGKLVHHMQSLSYTYDTYLIRMGLGPSISSVISESLAYSGLPYASSPVITFFGHFTTIMTFIY